MHLSVVDRYFHGFEKSGLVLVLHCPVRQGVTIENLTTDRKSGSQSPALPPSLSEPR